MDQMPFFQYQEIDLMPYFWRQLLGETYRFPLPALFPVQFSPTGLQLMYCHYGLLTYEMLAVDMAESLYFILFW